MKPELFHRIVDAGSAKARRFVSERGLAERLRFRNLAYPEVEKDFLARGGVETPALWDGAQLVQGEEAVLAWLARWAAAS